jgi:RsiW-degrading membrane proteinase PrsW (M82 family)
VTTATLAPPSAEVPDGVARSRRQRLLFWLGLALIVAGTAVCGWLLYGQLGDVMGWRAAGYAALFAAIPVLPIAAVFCWLNRANPEPWWMLAVALTWGALAATLMSLHLNEWLAAEVGDSQSISPRSAVFVAPWTEEATKGAIVFALVLWRGHRFNGVLAGVVLGGLAGLGFAFTENILYYGQFLQFQGDQLFTWSNEFEQLFVWRGVKAPFVHPLFTMCTGFGIGLAVRHRNVGVRVLAPAVGFCVAALLHMGYNAVASLSRTPEALNASYVGILMPTLLLGVTLVLLATRVERRAIAARLGDYTVYGWMSEAQIPFVVEAFSRRAARREARRLGKAQRRTVREFQRCGLALGVLRDRMVRGVAGAKERSSERDLVARYRGLRAKVVLPGVPSEAGRSVTAASSW